jgi:hypothetical protein
VKAPLYLFLVAIVLASCTKNSDDRVASLSSNSTTGQFIKYTIQAGNQYCDGNSYRAIELSEMKFIVRFDSTAIYQSKLPENQYDINKLYGFSDNNTDHHQYSARFGWRWSDKALRLFAYIYNKGVVTSKELSTVDIGAEINCFIKVTADKYLFGVDGTITDLPRMSTTEKAKGYQLYPYFGGDESAPHQIDIWIKNLN